MDYKIFILHAMLNKYINFQPRDAPTALVEVTEGGPVNFII